MSFFTLLHEVKGFFFFSSHACKFRLCRFRGNWMQKREDLYRECFLNFIQTVWLAGCYNCFERHTYASSSIIGLDHSLFALGEIALSAIPSDEASASSLVPSPRPFTAPKILFVPVTLFRSVAPSVR
jgi:hypothetical protein